MEGDRETFYRQQARVLISRLKAQVKEPLTPNRAWREVGGSLHPLVWDAVRKLLTNKNPTPEQTPVIVQKKKKKEKAKREPRCNDPPFFVHDACHALRSIADENDMDDLFDRDTFNDRADTLRRYIADCRLLNTPQFF